METTHPPDDRSTFQYPQAELIGPPSTGWVVHELHRPHETDPVVWAWCKVGVDEPGYTEMSFTLDDGATATDPGSGRVKLGAVLFQLWC